MAMSSATVAIADSSSSRSWDSLPEEILGCIVERLAVMDIAPFSAVCSSWAQAAPPRNKGRYRPLAPEMPYLLLPGEDGEESDYCTLQTFPEGRSYRLGPLPELRGKWFVGCQDGWLVLLDEFSNPSILNPLTKCHVQLPPITTLPNVEPIFDPSSDGSLPSKYRYRCPTSHVVDSYTLHRFRGCVGFKKIVFSTSPSHTCRGSYTALGIFDGGDKVLIFRSGEEKWIIIEELVGVCDAIYDHHHGKFLVVCTLGKVHAIDPNSPTTKATLVAACGFGSPEDRFLVVDLSGDLIQIHRMSDIFDVDGRGEAIQTFAVDVRKFSPRTMTWVGIESLGDNSLFLGNCHSTALQAQDVPGVEANCIYFTDNNWDTLGSSSSKRIIRDVGVYRLEDETFMPWYPNDSRLTWPWPAWITPTLL